MGSDGRKAIQKALLPVAGILTHEHESDRLILMSKRLQVILKDPEYREIQRVARSRRMSIAEWVRQALDLARRREPGAGVGKKLEVIRAAEIGRASCREGV